VGQSLGKGPCLTSRQVETVKLSISAACRRMTADQILDLADHLHAVIRERAVCGVEGEGRAFSPRTDGDALAEPVTQ
jgi:hypothetical protein